MSEPLRVAFNGRILSAPHLRGFGRYTLQLLAHLPAHGVRPLIFSPTPIPTEHFAGLPADSFEVHIGGRANPLLWDQLHWGSAARDLGAHLLHAPGNFGLPVRSRLPRVLTLHDAIDYVYYLDELPWRQRHTKGALVMRWLHASSRWAAHHIITVSQHAQRDITRRFGIPQTRITVTDEAADERFAPVTPEAIAALRAKFQLTRPYLLYLGGWEKRKNVRFLLQAFADADRHDLDLVLAGGGGDELQSVRAAGVELGLADRLRLIGRVDDSDLPALYSGSLAFAYPSHYEGFGLQLCEAMACGTAVLAARATCLPDVLGDGGATFALDATGELVQLIHRLADDTAFRQSLCAAARRRSGHFTWNRCAADTSAVYRKLTNSTRAGLTVS